MPIAIMALTRPGPKIVITMIASRIVGNETSTSTPRMATRSSQPPA